LASFVVLSSIRAGLSAAVGMGFPWWRSFNDTGINRICQNFELPSIPTRKVDTVFV